MNRFTVKSGIIFMIIAIVLGAFFKHSMKDLLTLEQIESFDTGIRYQMIHSLSLICLGFNSSKIKFHKMISNLFIIGIILFSFSIYFLSLKEFIGFSIDFIWPLTPIGGLILIISWLILLLTLNYKK